AVSKQLIPRSTAPCTASRNCASSIRPYVPPISQQPNPIAETLRSVLPNRRYSIGVQAAGPRPSRLSGIVARRRTAVKRRVVRARAYTRGHASTHRNRRVLRGGRVALLPDDLRGGPPVPGRGVRASRGVDAHPVVLRLHGVPSPRGLGRRRRADA